MKDLVQLHLAISKQDPAKVSTLAETIANPRDVLAGVKYAAVMGYAPMLKLLLNRFQGVDTLAPDTITIIDADEDGYREVREVWDLYVRWSALRSGWIGAMIRRATLA
jgi:hypothetical protein